MTTETPVNGSISEEITISDAQISVIREAFNRFDAQREGRIRLEHLNALMRNLGHHLSKEQIRDLIDQVGSSGHIDWDDFLPVVAAKVKEKEDRLFYKNLFRMLDKNRQGFIRCEDLRYILVGLAKEVDLTEQEIDTMIADIDEDGNGEVSFDEFYKLMTE